MFFNFSSVRTRRNYSDHPREDPICVSVNSRRHAGSSCVLLMPDDRKLWVCGLYLGIREIVFTSIFAVSSSFTERRGEARIGGPQNGRAPRLERTESVGHADEASTAKSPGGWGHASPGKEAMSCRAGWTAGRSRSPSRGSAPAHKLPDWEIGCRHREPEDRCEEGLPPSRRADPAGPFARGSAEAWSPPRHRSSAPASAPGAISRRRGRSWRVLRDPLREFGEKGRAAAPVCRRSADGAISSSSQAE